MTGTDPRTQKKPQPGRMLVISGPSGCGKSSVCHILQESPRVVFSVSATTRPKRKGEVQARDYFFVSKERFREHIEKGEFIEWAEVHGNLYGTLRQPMRDALAEGKIYLVEIDVQGGKQLKELGLPGVYVFIAPPSLEELRRRLEGRGTDAPEVIERRLQKAEEELRAQDRYDHVIVNEDLQVTADRVRALVGL